MEKITWVDLQKHIKLVFGEYEMLNFKDAVEKDRNGWNWVLSFEDMRSDHAVIIHTKLFFKLEKDQVHLRKNEFLYLYDINARYRLVKFKDLEELEKLLFKIMEEDMFGKDIMKLSEFLISPEQDVNDWLFKNEKDGFTVFDIEYKPSNLFKETKFNFLCNVNNNTEFKFSIHKNTDYMYTFIFSGKTYTIKKPDLTDISGTVGKFISETLEKFS